MKIEKNEKKFGLPINQGKRKDSKKSDWNFSFVF